MGPGDAEDQRLVCRTCGKRLIERPSHQRAKFENRIVKRHGKQREIRVKIIESLVIYALIIAFMLL